MWVCHFSGWKGAWRTEFLFPSSHAPWMRRSQQDPFLLVLQIIGSGTIWDFRLPSCSDCHSLGVTVTGGSSLCSSIYNRHVSQTSVQADLFSFCWFIKSWSESTMRWNWLKFPYLKQQCFETFSLWTLSSKLQFLLPREHLDASHIPNHVPSHRDSVGVSPYFHEELSYQLTNNWISGRPSLVVTVFLWEA